MGRRDRVRRFQSPRVVGVSAAQTPDGSLFCRSMPPRRRASSFLRGPAFVSESSNDFSSDRNRIPSAPGLQILV